jgi:hypothetical protein
MNPYKDLKDYQFWRKAVSRISKHEFDPIVNPGFQISKDDKIGTAGSCFAQHIAKKLAVSGFNYLVTEQGSELDKKERVRKNYGVFSARYGNLYTTRQLLQLIEEVLGSRVPQDIIWRRRDGKFVDALRPTIDPDGFEAQEDVVSSRRDHIKSVEILIKDMDVFVFTLGLTEAWVSKLDGTVYPLAPGVSAGTFDDNMYEFVNFTAFDVSEDLRKALLLLKEINPTLKVLLTVSPVPLIATYEPRHVLVSTSYSKASLLVAAHQVAKELKWIEYFPSYEIITGNYASSTYFEDDLREVNAVGVAHVMRLFMHHYTTFSDKVIESETKTLISSYKFETNQDIVCDEEEIIRMLK